MYINRESFTVDFNADLTRKEIAKKHGCSITTVRKRLIEYGLIERRYNKKRGESDRTDKPSSAQIQEWKEKAEKWDKHERLINS